MSSEPLAPRVTSLELFFDLVFVFTITQVSEYLLHAHDARHYVEAFLVLTITWWMYGGYAWLTNNVGTRHPVNRVLLLMAMGGFLVMAMATPAAFGQDALVFGLAYLVVNLVHAALFTRAPNESSRAIWRIAPINVGVALLIVGASFLPEEWTAAPWVLAIIVLLALPLKTASGFVMEPKHFVERHGLVLLIALGESVVSIGLGALGRPVSGELLLAALLTLGLIAALWWAYFDRDEARAEHALVHAETGARSRMGLLAFGYAELVMIGGFVSAAAGIKLVIEHLDETLPVSASVLLAAGVGVYLFGSVLFRLYCGLRPGAARVAAGCACAVSVPLGLVAGGLAQIGALLALLLAMLIVERPANDHRRVPG